MVPGENFKELVERFGDNRNHVFLSKVRKGEVWGREGGGFIGFIRVYYESNTFKNPHFFPG